MIHGGLKFHKQKNVERLSPMPNLPDDIRFFFPEILTYERFVQSFHTGEIQMFDERLMYKGGH